MKNFILIINIFFTQLLFSQIRYNVNIFKSHKYDVYSDDALQLILDKTNSSFFYTYLPPRTGDVGIKSYSEGSFTICGNILKLKSYQINKRFPNFVDISSIKFKIRKKRIEPFSTSLQDDKDVFVVSLEKSEFINFSGLNYENK